MSLIARVFRTFFADPSFQTEDQSLARQHLQSASICSRESTTPTGRVSSVFALEAIARVSVM